MSKSFKDALEEWKKDNKYVIGDDIGDEYYDYLEAGPTPVNRSLTQDNGPKTAAETIINRRKTS